MLGEFFLGICRCFLRGHHGGHPRSDGYHGHRAPAPVHVLPGAHPRHRHAHGPFQGRQLWRFPSRHFVQHPGDAPGHVHHLRRSSAGHAGQERQGYADGAVFFGHGRCPVGPGADLPCCSGSRCRPAYRSAGIQHGGAVLSCRHLRGCHGRPLAGAAVHRPGAAAGHCRH